MPTYIFQCPKCGLRIEKVLPMKQYASKFQCICGEMLKKDYKAMLPAYHDVPFDSVEFDMPGKPFPYSTRGQLKAEAKRRGLEVDIGLRSRSRERFGN